MLDDIRGLAARRFRPFIRRNAKNPTAEKLRLHEIAKRYFIMKERVSNDDFRELWTAYLKSKWWQARKTLVFQRAKGICEHCRSKACEECHHLTYAHRFNEPLEDLLGLCSACHRFFSNRGPNPVRDA
jgi:hypothetical protein